MASAFFRSPLSLETAQSLQKSLTDKSVACGGECVVWTGPTDVHGYGILRVTVHGKRLKLHIHRLAYFLVKRPTQLISEVHVSHLCHKKLCMNVNHLSY
jgi:hypothetical protein